MKIHGIVWLGTRTDHFAEMVGFARDVLGLKPVLQRQDFAVFDCLNHDRFEIFGPGDEEHTFMRAPVAGFLVDDVAAARTEMEAQGIEFIGPVQHDTGYAWSHFRAPDGHIYELSSRPHKA